MNPTLQKLFDEHNYEMLARALSDISDDKEFSDAITSVPMESLNSVARASPTLIPRIQQMIERREEEKTEEITPDVNKFERIYDPE